MGPQKLINVGLHVLKYQLCYRPKIYKVSYDMLSL
jgi:hypothetical protein